MRSFIVMACLCVSAAALGQERDSYREVDLGQLGDATLFSINDRGVIAAANAEGSFLFDSRSGQIVLHFPAGDTATAVSNNGNVAGRSVTGSAWLERDGAFQDLPLGQALDVNNDGVVAGFAGGFFVHAAVYSPADGSTTTPSLGGTQSVASGVNSAGQVVGHSTLPGGFTPHAFLWSAGRIRDLGTLGGDLSYGLAIDEDGRVVGSAATVENEELHAYVVDDAGMHDLGTLPGCARSEATAIRGPLIVGDSDLCGFAGSHAFVSDGPSMVDLNDVARSPDGFTYVSARGVNAAGTIIGLAASPDGRSTRPFVLVRSRDGE